MMLILFPTKSHKARGNYRMKYMLYCMHNIPWVRTIFFFFFSLLTSDKNLLSSVSTFQESVIVLLTFHMGFLENLLHSFFKNILFPTNFLLSKLHTVTGYELHWV